MMRDTINKLANGFAIIGKYGFSGITVANNQFTLSTTNGHQSIDNYDTGF